MGWLAGVLDDPPGFPYTPPGVDVLLTSNNMAGSSHDPLKSFAVASVAVSKPGGNAAGQDALHSAGVEAFEDNGARSKPPQQSQEKEALVCLLQHCICVSRPCEILGDSKSLCNTHAGAFLSWEQTLYTGRSPTRSTNIWMEGSHLSASLCFPLIRTFLNRTLSPTSKVDSFTRLSNMSLFLIPGFEAL